MGLDMNDLEACGSRTAVRRHIALAEHCATCGTEGRREPLPSLLELVDRHRTYLGVLHGDAA